MQKTYTEKVKFIESSLGKGNISRQGDDIALSCPVCKDGNKKKLSISLNTWHCHCWVCGYKSRSLVDLLKRFSTRSALDVFRSQFLNEIFLSTNNDNIDDEVFEYPDGYVPLVNFSQNDKNPNIRACFHYLHKRGLSERDLYKYRVGISSQLPRRVYFISLDENGCENYFVSRSIDDNIKMKYVNSGTDKTKIVFNDIDIDWDNDLYLVEGVFDAIQLKANTACLLGSSLAENSLLFKKIVANGNNVILALDSDVQAKMFKIADKLIKYGCQVKIFPLFEHKDVGSMNHNDINQSMNKLETWDDRMSIMKKISMIRSSSVF